MPSISETRDLPYSAEEMFDLVADVGNYAKFLPWVIATRIRSDTDSEMVADMVVGFKALRERFTSKVLKVRAEEIEVHYVDGPLRDLENKWKFTPREGGGCTVHFHVNFAFKNRVFETIAGQYFDRAFRKMVAAFEARADELYGNSNSSAHSVA